MKQFVVILLAGLLASCATSNTMDETYNATNKAIDHDLLAKGKAEIKIYRDDALLQKFANAFVYVDGVKKAIISDASVDTIPISPGKHNIYTKSGTLDANGGCGFNFVTEKGEIIYMSLSPKASGAIPIISILTNPLVCKFELAPVSVAKGERHFEKLQSTNAKGPSVKKVSGS